MNDNKEKENEKVTVKFNYINNKKLRGLVAGFVITASILSSSAGVKVANDAVECFIGNNGTQTEQSMEEGQTSGAIIVVPEGITGQLGVLDDLIANYGDQIGTLVVPLFDFSNNPLGDDNIQDASIADPHSVNYQDKDIMYQVTLTNDLIEEQLEMITEKIEYYNIPEKPLCFKINGALSVDGIESINKYAEQNNLVGSMILTSSLATDGKEIPEDMMPIVGDLASLGTSWQEAKNPNANQKKIFMNAEKGISDLEVLDGEDCIKGRSIIVPMIVHGHEWLGNGEDTIDVVLISPNKGEILTKPNYDELYTNNKSK